MKGDRILVVDDEREITNALGRELRPLCRELGLALQVRNSAAEALDYLAGDPGCAVVLSDIKMPGMSGLALLKEVEERWPKVVRIVLTGNAEIDPLKEELGAGIYEFLSKPWDSPNLESCLRGALAKSEELRKT